MPPIHHLLLLAFGLLVLRSPAAEPAPLTPGKPVDCSKQVFQPKSWDKLGLGTELIPWTGSKVVFLTIDNTLQTQVPDVPLHGISNFTVHWDTTSIVTHSEDATVRLRAWDGTDWSEWSTSAAFTINNQRPDVSQVEMRIASECAFGRYIIQPEARIGFINHNEDPSDLLTYRYGTTDNPANSMVAHDGFFTVSGLIPGTINPIYLWAENRKGSLSEPIVLDVYVLDYQQNSESFTEPGNVAPLGGESTLEDVPFTFEASVSAGVPILRFPYQSGKVQTIECSEGLNGEEIWKAIPDTSFIRDSGWMVWVNDGMKALDAPRYQFYRVRSK